MKSHLAPKPFNPPPVELPLNVCGISELARRAGMSHRTTARYLTDLKVKPVAYEVSGKKGYPLFDLRAAMELLKFRPVPTVNAAAS